MRYHQGFTLTELAIVIVIIGLLAGGIMGGGIILKSSELKSVGADMQMYKMAVNTFHQQYFGLPGDVSNAEEFWGTDSAGCPDGGGTGTCNGDADGNWSADGKEGLRGWEQMGLAGIIPSNYTGALTSGDLVTGTHIPSSKVSGGGYVMRNVQGYSKTANTLE
ncbi:MAG: prepilin-type N-terminal cleavage/methylation domain-containing protein, partial [Alphaproteobacteria bacterium]|nr:prepilin-type N-terminal cleavage/methylation domain-containing protein [Alphaproteobacteria bacterium]